jgi:hypothetical protein
VARQDRVNVVVSRRRPWHARDMTAVPDRARSLLATVVGWVLAALVAFWLLGALIGTLRFVLRVVITILVVGALVTLYLRLKSPRSG